ncbi:MAG: TIGR04150 pseudo-rSAM protein, partial [Marinifilaceae bacterium]
MMNKTERVYLYLEPYTNVFFSEKRVLVYNTIDGNRIIVENIKNIKLLSQLTNDENLYCVLLEIDQLKDPIINGFIESLQDLFMGDIVRESLVEAKPHQLIPILNLQKDLDRFKKDLYSSIGDDVMKYIFDVSIYIGGNSNHQLDNAFKQFLFPKKSSKSTMSLSIIKKIASELEHNSYGNINIVGGDISDHKDLNKIFNILDDLKMQKTIHLYYKDNFIDVSNRNNFKTRYYIDFPIINNIDFITLKSKDINFSFVIQKEEDVEKAEALILEYSLENYLFQPYYNGENIDLFEKNIYLNEDDILEVKLNQNDIFSNMKINKNNFGKLVVFSDGEVHANVNKKSLGNINDRDFHSLIFNELSGDESWKDVRMNAHTCKDCVYNCL